MGLECLEKQNDHLHKKKGRCSPHVANPEHRKPPSPRTSNAQEAQSVPDLQPRAAFAEDTT